MPGWRYLGQSVYVRTHWHLGIWSFTSNRAQREDGIAEVSSSYPSDTSFRWNHAATSGLKFCSGHDGYACQRPRVTSSLCASLIISWQNEKITKKKTTMILLLLEFFRATLFYKIIYSRRLRSFMAQKDPL